MKIEIDSHSGRIGPFWWINSDTRPHRFDFGFIEGVDGNPGHVFICWGTCGFGSDNSMFVTMQPLGGLEGPEAQAAVLG